MMNKQRDIEYQNAKASIFDALDLLEKISKHLTIDDIERLSKSALKKWVILKKLKENQSV